jgi:glycosyltransferase involved in cell wall biosynthesis
VSVVMPLYNRAATVSNAIDSVLAQTFDGFELIVVDDGSTDGSADVVEAIGDRRIRLIRLGENRGGNAARNEGIRQARGAIISFLDSDDAFLPDKLQTVVNAFEANPGIGAVIDSFRKLYPSGRSKDCRNPALSGRDAVLAALFDRRLWKSTPSISVTPDAAQAAGLFDERLRRRQDYDFLVRLIRATEVISIPTITWVKTKSEDAISADLAGFMPAFTAFWDRHPEYYRSPEFRRGFDADLARHFGKLGWRARGRQIAADGRTVAKRIGWGGLLRSLAGGGVELARLAIHRRRMRSG